MTDDKHSQSIDVDELAKGKVDEIDRLLQQRENLKSESLASWLSILKQIITAADLHRSNPDAEINSRDTDSKRDPGDSIYADFSDDNERFHAIDLTEQFATNSVKWTIRVRAFKIVHEIVPLLVQQSRVQAGRQDTSKAPLLKYLPDLIRLSFVAATSPYDELKMQGFEMFHFLIDKFASVEEKEFAGHSIMEQYKTQVFSAIKPAFNLDAPPYITAIASQICSLWICRNIEKEASDLKRAFQLMLVSVDKLEGQSVNQHNKLYTESELEQERLAILGSWAHLYVASTEITLDEALRLFKCLPRANAEILHNLVQPQLSRLANRWWEALKDYALLIMPAPRLIGTSHDNGQVYTREVALMLFEPIWSKLVFASAVWLFKQDDKSRQQPNTVVDIQQTYCDNLVATEKETSRYKYTKFISGIILKELYRCLLITTKKDTKVQLPESTILSIKSLQLLLCDIELREALLGDAVIAKEFYNILYCILVNSSRDLNRNLIRSALETIYKSMVVGISTRKDLIHHGLAKLVELLMGSMKDIAISQNEKSGQIDELRVQFSVRLNNLLELIRTHNIETMGETPLREAVLVLFQEMLQFRPDPIVSLTCVDQLQNFLQVLSQENKVYFIDSLIRVQSEFVIKLIGSEEANNKLYNTLVDSHFNSMRSSLTLLQSDQRKELLSIFIKNLVDANSPTRNLNDVILKQTELLQKQLQSSLDDELDPGLVQRLETLRKSHEEMKIKSKTIDTSKKAITKSSGAKPPPSTKIKLRADFSNFYK